MFSLRKEVSYCACNMATGSMPLGVLPSLQAILAHSAIEFWLANLEAERSWPLTRLPADFRGNCAIRTTTASPSKVSGGSPLVLEIKPRDPQTRSFLTKVSTEVMTACSAH